ncbi:MAG: hypothetical protein ACOX9A_01375 [Anaerolineae bacterium]|jgi:hypothetical protein
MNQTKRIRFALAFLLVLLLLPLGFPPQPVQAEETRFHGILHYTERGPGASVDGIATSFLSSAVAGVAAARLQTSMMPIINAATSMNLHPGMREINDMLRQGVPVDMASILPISAVYSADVEFTLIQDKEGNFVLESGTLHWLNSNDTSFEYEGGSLVDQFAGAGAYPLDPSSDQITLTFDFEGEQPMFELEVSISHPTPTNGESTWTALGGLFTMWIHSTNGHQVMGGQMINQEFPEEPIGGESKHGIYYYRRAPLSELRGMETWRNLLDAQVFVRYEIYDQCSVSIIEPVENERLVFSEDADPLLEGMVEATVLPEDWGDAVYWIIPEIVGSKLTYDPEDAQGSMVEYRYEDMPSRNEQFGRKRISLHLEPSISDRCKAPDPRNVRVFFPRDATNNFDGDVPNWFYYWKQTRAAQGHGDAMIYDPACDDAYGYYVGMGNPTEKNRSVIYLCDLHSDGFIHVNPVTGQVQRGIDMFAGIVLHEWTHLENDHDWWGPRGYRPSEDRDNDRVKDDREAAYGLDPKMMDTFGLGFRDCEYPAYLQQHTWPIGSANREDWAYPGKQSGGN